MRRKAFLFTFLVLSLLLAACVHGGGTEGENSYTIYYPCLLYTSDAADEL